MKLKVRNPIYAILILILLSALLGAILMHVRVQRVNNWFETRVEQKIEGIDKTLTVLEKDVNEEMEQFLERSVNVAELMAILLREHMDGDIYTGPRVFYDGETADGFVVEIQDGKVIYPSEAGNIPNLEIDWLKSEPTYSIMSYPDIHGILTHVLLDVRKISKNYYYIDISTLDEIGNTALQNARVFETLSEIEKSYDCRMLLVNMDDDGDVPLEFIYYSEEFPEDLTPESFGITREVLDERPEDLTLYGKDYRGSYKAMEFLDYSLMVVILSEMNNEYTSIVGCVALIVILVLTIGISIIMWLYFHQSYVRDHDLLPSQVQAYKPVQLQKAALSVGILGAIAIFLIAICYLSLNNLKRESVADEKALDTVMERLDQNTNQVSAYQEDEEEWGVYFAERIAGLYVDSDTFNSPELLKKASDLSKSQYIIIFDSSGNEIMSSNGLIGYSLSESFGLEGFTPLLSGTKTIIMDPQEDRNLGKVIQLIGTQIPIITDGNLSYYALIMAIDAQGTWQSADQRIIDEFLENSTPEGNLAVVVFKSDNTVAYSSSPDLLGYTVSGLEYTEGMPKNSDLDSYVINSVRYYGPYDSDENYIAYYLTANEYIQINSMVFASISAIGFGIIMFIVCSFMLKPYTRQAFKEAVRLKESQHQDTTVDIDPLEDLFAKGDDDPDESLINRWKALLPEQKSTIFLQTFVTIVAVILIALQLRLNQRVGRSTVGFVLTGNWKRGLNLLGWAGVLITILGFVAFTFFKNILQKILCAALDAKGETVCRLVSSLLQYVTVIAVIYLVLGFLGFNTGIQLTSIGIVSLAISLGSQNLVADILAGVFIIFEGYFHVGDIIEVDGFRGVVQEIGVRSTKILGIGDNVKIIGNQSIKNVMNLSKLNSWFAMEFPISSDQPLSEIEAMLERELPEIGKAHPEIISGPYYKGIWSITQGGMAPPKFVLSIICECDESNTRRVRRTLNHDIVELFQRNGYKWG